MESGSGVGFADDGLTCVVVGDTSQEFGTCGLDLDVDGSLVLLVSKMRYRKERIVGLGGDLKVVSGVDLKVSVDDVAVDLVASDDDIKLDGGL